MCFILPKNWKKNFKHRRKDTRWMVVSIPSQFSKLSGLISNVVYCNFLGVKKRTRRRAYTGRRNLTISKMSARWKPTLAVGSSRWYKWLVLPLEVFEYWQSMRSFFCTKTFPSPNFAELSVHPSLDSYQNLCCRHKASVTKARWLHFCPHIATVKAVRNLKTSDLLVQTEELLHNEMSYSYIISLTISSTVGCRQFHLENNWDAAAAINMIRAAIRMLLYESTPTSILREVSSWEIEPPGTWSAVDVLPIFCSIWTNQIRGNRG